MSDTITVIGNLAANPERRTTHKGETVAAFRVGSTHRRFDRDSNTWVDSYTNWYAVSAFRALGEHALASFHKGDRVILTGTLRLREWDNGTKQGTTAEIDADALGHDLLWGTTSYQRSGTSDDIDGSAISGANAEASTMDAVIESPAALDGRADSGGDAVEPRTPQPQWAGGENGETPF